jgi:hypothetical protein
MDDVGFRLNPKGDLTTILDNAEMTIETIRKDALKMVEDLENVNNSVECVRNSKLLDELSDGKYAIPKFIVQYILPLYLMYGSS